MAGILSNTLLILGKTIQNKSSNPLALAQIDFIRNISKHWNPKFKKERKAKVIKVQLPDMKPPTEFTEEETRTFYKKHGFLPMAPWTEKGFFLACTGSIFEAYVPREGDGKYSSLSTSGMKEGALFIGKKTTSMMAIRKIKSYLDDFHADDFAVEARTIYIRAHKALANKQFLPLRQYVTEKVHAEMKYNVANKQIRWKFIESLEPARIVRARNTSVGSKDNVFAQLTVRFHTKQTLAIYDRFGRLMHGSRFVAKDVLEYIVFERMLAYEYGKWRIHGKIIPDWQAPREPSILTTRKYMPPVEEVPKVSSSIEIEPIAETKPQEPKIAQ